MALAVQGNPAILALLFAPASHLVHVTPLGEELQALAPAIVSKQVAARFIGYAESQLARIESGSTYKRTNRPELIAAHGYDTKYAAHALRIAIEGEEILYTGRVTYPAPESRGALLRRMRAGELPVDEAIDLIARAIDRLKAADYSCTLPERPDLAAVQEWMRDARSVVYRRTSLLREPV